MLPTTQAVRTFPSARIPSVSGGLPVEVSLIAQLGHGAGDQFFARASARQQAHASFIDELDEPSARIGGVDLAKGDATSLYTFAVGAKGHPFHRHAGHRVFTAITGSGGAQLRFSSATPAQIERDPRSFVRALRYVEIPPDSLFTVRFGGDTWHQFAPLQPRSPHPAFFALSCHTNELGGELPDAVRAQVAADAATIPALTELLPASVSDLLRRDVLDPTQVPTVALSLEAPRDSWQGRLCAATRGVFGRIRSALSRRGAYGFRSDSGSAVEALAHPPEDSLLLRQFAERFDHEDTFRLMVEAGELSARSASAMLALLLEGFLENRPVGVTRLMALRNWLVKPLRLRTSPLGCPVSSLLCAQPETLFAGRFAVIEQHVDAADKRAQVILGADDRHLRFRSCVGVQVLADGRIAFTLGTRVQYRNAFGRAYMKAIARVHRDYIAPTMLRFAVSHVLSA